MNEPLEDSVGRALRRAPLRRAPPSLEARVLEELARRAASPWWQKSFARWPRSARAGFTAITSAMVAAAFAASRPWAPGGAWAGAGTWAGAGAWVSGAPSRLPWARSALTVVDAVRVLDAALVRAVPLEWLYGTMAAGAILYALLFGLGAAAYRTLYLNLPSTGDRS
jgi:hypothetical protein